MTLPRRLVLLALLLAVQPIAAEAPPAEAAAPDPTAAPQISPAEERSAGVLDIGRECFDFLGRTYVSVRAWF